jgi:ATP-binding cassette subfamily B protein
MGIAVDVVVKQQDSIIAQLGIKDIFGQFLVLSFFTLVIWVLESVFEYAYERLWHNLAQNSKISSTSCVWMLTSICRI